MMVSEGRETICICQIDTFKGTLPSREERRRVLDVHFRDSEVSVGKQRVDPPSWANSAHEF